MKPFCWALIGPGGIAQRFAAALPDVAGAELHWVLGRDAARAASFARQVAGPGVPPPRVVVDLACLLAEPALDAVYIATPHAQHGDSVRQCLAAGKAVLCEKPLVPNLAQAEALVQLARQRKVFLMEAVWTRFLPTYTVVQGWLREQAIGPLRGLQSSFCFNPPFDAGSRIFDPALAGGALLDIGIYNLTMTRWVMQQALGACPQPLSIQASGVLAPTGVDQRVAGMLNFPGGITSQFICAVDGRADNGLRIFGERGVITVPVDFWQATEAVLTRPGQPEQRVKAPFRGNGFEYEIEAAQACVRAGQIESAVMPHAETLATLAWMDEIRRQLGVRYPFE
ncbi:Gfo/Idh/MocA family oxidoreductase [Roseateles sp.]|uniref:Gfo/Idh/MocA family protein n=1 Tax=Roseateles sp. TaxID=1971397 RepID=UPI00286C8CB5|nr:Gfo/Idh/MocA family oxidoreductase [Roseateles sp.]